MIKSPVLTASSTLVGLNPFYAAIAKILGVGVALRAEANDGNGFAFEGVEGGVLFVDHL